MALFYLNIASKIQSLGKNIGTAYYCCGSALGFNADPDPAFYLSADPDPESNKKVPRIFGRFPCSWIRILIPNTDLDSGETN